MGRGRGYGRPPWMEGPPFGGGHWHGGRRMRRGEIRFALLSVLAEGPGHGYELIGRLEAKTGGVWRPSPGSVYPTLQSLEDEGLVRSVERDGKRVFELRAFLGARPILICVKRRSEVCRHRRLVRQGPIYVNRIMWRSYPYQGRGTYRVRWYVDLGDGYTRIGRDLTF